MMPFPRTPVSASSPCRRAPRRLLKNVDGPADRVGVHEGTGGGVLSTAPPATIAVDGPGRPAAQSTSAQAARRSSATRASHRRRPGPASRDPDQVAATPTTLTTRISMIDPVAFELEDRGAVSRRPPPRRGRPGRLPRRPGPTSTAFVRFPWRLLRTPLVDRAPIASASRSPKNSQRNIEVLADDDTVAGNADHGSSVFETPMPTTRDRQEPARPSPACRGLPFVKREKGPSSPGAADGLEKWIEISNSRTSHQAVGPRRRRRGARAGYARNLKPPSTTPPVPPS